MPRLVVPAMLMLVSACASTRLDVAVNGLSSGGAPASPTYVLLPGLDGVSSSDLQFREFSAIVARALATKGMQSQVDAEEAEVLVSLSWSVGDLQVIERPYSVPVFEYVPGNVTTSSSGHVVVQGADTVRVAGQVSGTKTRVTLPITVRLVAIDLVKSRRTNQLEELWRTTIFSNGDLFDLRRVFPMMIAAALPYLGTNTGRIVEVQIREGSRLVKAIKAGY